MASLDGEPRTATLTAPEPALVWRWEPGWLDEAVVDAGLAGALREPAERRAHVPG